MRAILQRDFVAEAARVRSVVLRTVLGGVVSVVALMILWEAESGPRFDEDEVGRHLFLGGSISLLVLLFLLTPPLVVGSILQERTQGTLDLLLASPVRPRSIALAKLLSRSGVALQFALAGLPVLGLCLLFGGVPVAPIVCVLVSALAVVLEVGAWGVWVSSLTRRPATAAVLSYLFPAVRWWLCIHGPSAIGMWDTDPLAVASMATTPVPALLWSAETALGYPFWTNSIGGLAGNLLFERPETLHLSFAILLAIALVGLAGLHLRREAEPAPDLLRRFRRKRRLEDLPRFENPVAWKEVRLLNTAYSRILFYAVLGILILMFALSFAAMDDRGGETISILLAIEIPLVAFVAAVNGALTLGHERTQGSWDLLRASRLSAADIVAGKIAGVLRGVAFLALVPAAEILGAFIGGAFHFGTLVVSAMVLAALPAFWAAVGLSYGIRADRRREAVIRTCVLFGVLLVVFPAIALVVGMSVRGDEFPMVFLIASPPPLVFVVTQSVTEGGETFRHKEDFISFIWLLFYAGAAIGLLRALPRWLARRMEEERSD